MIANFRPSNVCSFHYLDDLHYQKPAKTLIFI